MTAHTVEIYASLSVPGEPARDAAIEILRAMTERQPPYDRVALVLGLQELRFPIDATLSVPVEAHAVPRPMRWECELEIGAADNERFFPRFAGTVTITPVGADKSEIWLQGAYEPPLGKLGANIDMTILRGAASASLRRFVDWLAGEATKRVQERERERARAAMRFRQ